MDMIFWIGVLLGALLGVLADFAVRPLQRFLDRRLEDRTTVRTQSLLANLQADRQATRDFLLLQVLETTYIGALVAIFAGVFYALSSGSFALPGFPIWLGSALSVAGQAVSLIGAMLIVRIAGDAIRVVRNTLSGAVDL